MRMVVITISLLFIAGCADLKSHATNAPQSVSEPVRPEHDTKPVIEDVKDHLTTELHSINQAQQTQTGLITSQFQKIADNVDAAAVKVQTDVTTTLRADLKAQADITASAITTASATLRADIQAQATAIAGIGNKIDSSVQTYSSGRDTNTTQFTPEMASMLVNQQRQQVIALVVLILSVTAIVIVYMEVRHRRSRGSYGAN